MSTALTPIVFSHPVFGDIRTVHLNNQTWFVATDIARVLEHASAKDLVRNIKKEYRDGRVLPTPGGDQPLSLINTSGLFQAVMSSRKPQAEPFQTWVLEEVLPGIAQTGAYVDTEGRMGQTLGEATGGAIGIDTPALRSLDHRLAELTATLERIGQHNDRQDRRIKGLVGAFTRSISQVTRLAGMRREAAAQDPNRPLSDADIERFKFLLTQGVSLREIARRLNRTHQVISRFTAENPDVVLRALQQPLL